VYKLWSSSLCSFLQPPVTSSFFGPNILLNITYAAIYGKYKHKILLFVSVLRLELMNRWIYCRKLSLGPNKVNTPSLISNNRSVSKRNESVQGLRCTVTFLGS
jgi:hypothetical protein